MSTAAQVEARGRGDGYAVQKTVAAFRKFEAGAKGITGPRTISIRLTPDDSKTRVDQGR